MAAASHPMGNNRDGPHLTVAVEGCCHGELDAIYSTIAEAGHRGVHVDVLLICGDFQCTRNAADLLCVAVPPKYRRLHNFQDYVTGVRVAPVLTIFIGGNHEASNVLHSLYYGGFVAPNIYFLGFGGAVRVGGVRIAGLSGIYNQRHYRVGHYELPPYTDDSLRSIYHLRELEVFRMAHLSRPVDVFLSHDWPAGVWEHGDKQRLLSRKAFLRDDMVSGRLGRYATHLSLMPTPTPTPRTVTMIGGDPPPGESRISAPFANAHRVTCPLTPPPSSAAPR